MSTLVYPVAHYGQLATSVPIVLRNTVTIMRGAKRKRKVNITEIATRGVMGLALKSIMWKLVVAL